MTRLVLVTSAIIYMFFFAPNVIYAHKLDIISWFQGKILHIEGQFDCGKKVMGGDVKIFDSDGNILLDGETDQKGHLSFKVKKIDSLKIVLSTPCGHKNSLKIPKNKIQTILDSVKNNNGSKLKHDSISDSKIGDCTLKHLELIISNQLEEKLQPINRVIAYSQKKRIGIYDILGGIGYILGLMGLMAYMKSNRVEKVKN